jgi:hypothetical protein
MGGNPHFLAIVKPHPLDQGIVAVAVVSATDAGSRKAASLVKPSGGLVPLGYLQGGMGRSLGACLLKQAL